MSGSMEREGMGGWVGEWGGDPKNCQGISFSKHRKLEALQDRGVCTHTFHTSDPSYYTENTHTHTHTSGTLI